MTDTTTYADLSEALREALSEANRRRRTLWVVSSRTEPGRYEIVLNGWMDHAEQYEVAPATGRKALERLIARHTPKAPDRFALDEDIARMWLTVIRAAAEGDEAAAEILKGTIHPDIYDEWTARAETAPMALLGRLHKACDLDCLVTGAVDQGGITSPAGTGLKFGADHRSHWYWAEVTLRDGKGRTLTIQSAKEELDELGKLDSRGEDAAVEVLRIIVAKANSALDDLDARISTAKADR